MTLQAEIHCPECQELIKDVDSLDTGECPWCGAFLVNVDLKSNNSKLSKTEAAPDPFDDITVSDDESLVMTKPSKVKHNSKLVDDDLSLEDILHQFKREQNHKPKAKAESKRKQVVLSESSDDEWSAPISSKGKNKTVPKKKKQKVDDVFDFDVNFEEDLLEDEDDLNDLNDLDYLDDLDYKFDVKKKHYSLSASSDSGSEYHQSDSEEEPLPKTSKHAQKETKTAAKSIAKEKRGQTRKVAKVDKGKAKAKSSAAPTTSTSLSSSSPATSSSSSASPSTTTKPNRAHAYIQFNKEMRGKLAKENRDLSSKDLSKLISSIWNKMSEAQKASYTNKATEPKRVSPPSGNGFLLYKSEQFPSVRKEHKLKGENTMANVSSIICMRWKNLDPNIKETYHLRAKKIREDWMIEHPREFEAYKNSVSEKISGAKMGKKKSR